MIGRKLAAGFLMILPVILSAQEAAPGGKVHGFVFGDYFYKWSGDSTGTATQYQGLRKGQTAFQFRMLHLYYDHQFNENFSSRFLIEGNDKIFDGNGRHSVIIKEAYLEWKNLVPGGSIYMGLVPTPTWWDKCLKLWGYRCLEKTLLDFRGLGAQSDIGAGIKGHFGNNNMFGYHVMIGNGNAQRAENDNSKKFYGSFSVVPIKGVIAEVYIDREQGLKNRQGNFKLDKTTYRGFVAYQAEKHTLGAEWGEQSQTNVTDSTDVIPSGFSFFGHTSFRPNMRLIARADFFNPDRKIKKQGYTEVFALLGLDYTPMPNVHVIPNIWINSYSKKASGVTKRDTDAVFRMTLWYLFK